MMLQHPSQAIRSQTSVSGKENCFCDYRSSLFVYVPRYEWYEGRQADWSDKADYYLKFCLFRPEETN